MAWQNGKKPRDEFAARGKPVSALSNSWPRRKGRPAAAWQTEAEKQDYRRWTLATHAGKGAPKPWKRRKADADLRS